MKLKFVVNPPRTRGRARVRLLAKQLHLSDPRALGSLLPPAALMFAILGLWRIGADLQLANSFPIQGGLFSHWMTWMCAAAILEIVAYRVSHARAAEGSEGGRQN